MPRAARISRDDVRRCALDQRQHWRPGACEKWHGIASVGAVASLLLLATLQPCTADQLLPEVQPRMQLHHELHTFKHRPLPMVTSVALDVCRPQPNHRYGLTTVAPQLQGEFRRGGAPGRQLRGSTVVTATPMAEAVNPALTAAAPDNSLSTAATAQLITQVCQQPAAGVHMYGLSVHSDRLHCPFGGFPSHVCTASDTAGQLARVIISPACVQQPPDAPGAAAPLPAPLGSRAAAASAPGPGGSGLTTRAASSAQLAAALQNADVGTILLQSERRQPASLQGLSPCAVLHS